MTLSEFDDWMEFYLREPFDDRARYRRPAALVAHQVGRSKMNDLLQWLDGTLTASNGGVSEEEAGLEEVAPGELSSADRATIMGLGMKPPKKRAPAASKGKK